MVRVIEATTVIIVLLALAGCRIEVRSPIGGQVRHIQSDSVCPEYTDCYLDLEGSEEGVDVGFEAIPSAGYRFTGWAEGPRFLCGGSMEPCLLENLPRSITSNGEVVYLAPTFEMENLSTSAAWHRLSVGSDLFASRDCSFFCELEAGYIENVIEEDDLLLFVQTLSVEVLVYQWANSVSPPLNATARSGELFAPVWEPPRDDAGNPRMDGYMAVHDRGTGEIFYPTNDLCGQPWTSTQTAFIGDGNNSRLNRTGLQVFSLAGNTLYPYGDYTWDRLRKKAEIPYYVNQAVLLELRGRFGPLDPQRQVDAIQLFNNLERRDYASECLPITDPGDGDGESSLPENPSVGFEQCGFIDKQRIDMLLEASGYSPRSRWTEGEGCWFFYQPEPDDFGFPRDPEWGWRYTGDVLRTYGTRDGEPYLSVETGPDYSKRWSFNDAGEYFLSSERFDAEPDGEYVIRYFDRSPFESREQCLVRQCYSELFEGDSPQRVCENRPASLVGSEEDFPLPTWPSHRECADGP